MGRKHQHCCTFCKAPITRQKSYYMTVSHPASMNACGPTMVNTIPPKLNLQNQKVVLLLHKILHRVLQPPLQTPPEKYALWHPLKHPSKHHLTYIDKFDTTCQTAARNTIWKKRISLWAKFLLHFVPYTSGGNDNFAMLSEGNYAAFIKMPRLRLSARNGSCENRANRFHCRRQKSPNSLWLTKNCLLIPGQLLIPPTVCFASK